MSSGGFTGDLERIGSQVTVRLRGELDSSSSPKASGLIVQALADRPRTLVFDLSDLQFMDSAGIWLLVETHRRCLASGTELRLAGGQRPAVAQALSLSGVEELIGSGEVEREAEAQRVRLRLYVSSHSPAGPAIEQSVRALSERLPAGLVELEVIDVFDEPRRAQEDRVIATPTLIKVQPAPELRLIGAIEDPDAVLRHLVLADLGR
jgi:circadian clock protein KaiB